MREKRKKPVAKRVELARHISVPVLLLSLLTLPWFFGGREAFGQLLIAGLTLLLFLSWLVVSRHRALRVSTRPHLIVLSLAAVVAWSVLSLMWSVSQFQSLGLLTTLIEAAIIFVVARDVLHDEDSHSFFLPLWVMAGLVVWGIGAGLFLAGDYDRMTSLFYWANPLATYFLTTILASLQLQRAAKGRAAWLWLAASGVLTSGLILTYSRAAWLIGALILVIIVWVVKDRRAELIRLGKMLLIAGVFTLALLGIRHFAYRQPTLNIQSRITESVASTSVKDRFQYWQEASVLFAERPLIGWGVGTYPEVHPGVQISPTTAGNNPHNSLLQSFVELGLVGSAAYLTFLGAWLWYGYQLFRKRGDVSLPMTAWLVVTAIGLHSLLDLVTNYPVLILALAIWLALALGVPEREFRLKTWPAAVPLTAAGLVLALALWVRWQVYVTSVNVALIQATTGDFANSTDLYRQVFQQPIYDPDILSQAAVSYIDQFDAQPEAQATFLNPALNYAQQAVAQEPQDAKHVFALASVLERQGKVTEALANYRKATQLDPHDNPQYQISYARLLQREGFVSDAIVSLKTILDEYTLGVIANRNLINIGQRLAVGQAVLADLYGQKGDLGHAQEAITKAEALSPQNPFVLQIKAKLTK